MKNPARASIFCVLTLAGLFGTFACWTNAPSGGSLADADVPPITGDASGIIVKEGGAPTDATLAEGGDADGGEAGDAIAPVLPHASAVVAAGIGFGCRIDGQGNVFCWGDNSFGQAGNAVEGGAPDAGAVEGGAAGDSGGGADAAGAPDAGSSVPGYHQVAGIANATALALGDYHACAVTASHAVYCWGLNNSYQLGHPTYSMNDLVCSPGDAGATICNPTPEQVDASAVAIAAAGAWTCIVAADGTLQCWGAVQAVTSAGSVTCGSGTSQAGGTCYAAPYAIPGVNGVTQLAVAFDHACALIAGNQVVCWGSNTEGQVSPQACPQNDCTTPTAGAGLPPSSSVAVGASFTCALVTDGGTVSCFGDNAYGELGQHKEGAFITTPVTVAGLGPASELVAGGSQPGTQTACAIVSALGDGGTGGGNVLCWGVIASDAGPGVPVAVAGLPAMAALGVPDGTYECGVSVDQSTWCWDLAGGAAPTQIH